MEKNKIIFMLIDPYKVNIKDLIKDNTGKTFNGIPVVRYRVNQWGQDHPAIELFSIHKSTGITTIKELKEKLGVIDEEGRNEATKESIRTTSENGSDKDRADQ